MSGLDIRLKHQLGAFQLDVSLQSEAGGVTALFGPSGAGKTSLIRAVAGLLEPDDGYIEIGGHVLLDSSKGISLAPKNRRVGYVFQDARLFPHMNVRNNLEYGKRFHKNDVQLAPVADMLGIEALLDRMPRDLSGGEAQRVAIGRALLAAPNILAMDEPLAALDDARRSEILPYLDNLQSFSNLQILYVSHAMSEVARLADTIVLMRSGRVTRSGLASELLADPSAVPEIGVREAGASLTVKISRLDAGDGLSALATSQGELLLPRIEAQEGDLMRVRILAGDIILARERPAGLSALNILPATVTDLQEGAGPGVAVALSSGTDKLVARITRRSAQALALSPGMQCFAIIKSVSVASRNIGRRPDRTETQKL